MSATTAHKPGRPSHCYHTFLISALRLVLDVEVRPGNEHHGRHGLSGLLRILDGLASEERPYLVRGDGDYGNETVMRALEDRGQNYLFRQRMTKRTKELIAELAAQTGWKDAGQGWQASSSELLLQGWTRKTACCPFCADGWLRGMGRQLSGKPMLTMANPS